VIVYRPHLSASVTALSRPRVHAHPPPPFLCDQFRSPYPAPAQTHHSPGTAHIVHPHKNEQGSRITGAVRVRRLTLRSHRFVAAQPRTTFLSRGIEIRPARAGCGSRHWTHLRGYAMSRAGSSGAV
jgi:hypothetical protein